MGYIFDIPEFFLLTENYSSFIDWLLDQPIDNFIKKQLILEWSELNSIDVNTNDIKLVYPEEVYP